MKYWRNSHASREYCSHHVHETSTHDVTLNDLTLVFILVLGLGLGLATLILILECLIKYGVKKHTTGRYDLPS
jgi:hypothetical protein